MNWRRAGRPAALVLALGVALSLALAQYQASHNHRVLRQRLARVAQVAADGVLQRLAAYHTALQGLRGVVLTAGPDQLGQPEVARYAASTSAGTDLPGALGLGFIRRVSRADVDRFVRLRRQSSPGYAVHELAPHEGDRYLVQAEQPLDGGVAALGLDVAGEPRRSGAALRAMRAGTAMLSAPLGLVPPLPHASYAYLLLLPVYRDAVAPPLPLRAEELSGWVYLPLQAGAILRNTAGGADAVGMGLEDVQDGAAVTVLPLALPDGAALAQASVPLQVYGRQWRLTVAGGALYAGQQNLVAPGTVLGAGLLATAALAALAAVAGAGRRRRNEVQTEQAKLAAIVDSSADAIIGKSLDGRITSWNQGAERLFGYRAEEALGRTVGELLVPAGREHEESEILAQLTAGHTVTDLETQRRHRDGRLIDVWVAVAPVRHPNGQVMGAAKTVRDITERKAAEARVLAANARLEDMVARRTAELRNLNVLLGNVLDAATGVAIIATDLAGTITVFNRGAEAMLGYQAAELLHRATPLCFHDPVEVAARASALSRREDQAIDGFRAMVLDAERDGAHTHEWTYVRRSGERIAVSLIVTAMRDGQGALSGYLGIAVDITQRNELMASLQRAKEEALAASAAKSTFLANMSHEIRTPMNAVLGMLQLMQGTELNTRQRDYASKAERAGRSLLQLLNDVLDYSKIEAGKLRLDPHPFDPDALMRDLGVILAGNQGRKEVEVVFDMDPRLPAVLIGDSLRLQQVLINLAGNALKFTERGHVKVALELLEDSGATVRLRVAVSDTGIGISEEQRLRIFEGFTQAEASISRRFGGTGLGLVISSRLLALMDATLQLDSAPGLGSRFWFELALQRGQAPALAAAPAALRVLVVDDQPEAAEALARMAAGLGWHTTSASSGADALAALAAAPAPYDVVLLDWRMPQRDGLAVARDIRDLHGADGAPQVLMVTAFGGDMLAEQAGPGAPPYADVLTKPVTPNLLRHAVQRALAGTPGEPQQPPAPGRRLDGMRILLVEDNALNRQVAGELLANEGALVQLAVDGRDGLARLREAGELPDVVLMDMQMPEMDGLEATRRIRAELGTQLRIIAMTANVSDADRTRCAEAGMNDHIGKPIDLEALVRCLRGHGPALASAPVAPAAADYEAPAVVLARFGGNVAVYRRALEGFPAQCLELSGQAAAALRSGADGEAAAALHTLKGIAATVGARALGLRVAALERTVVRRQHAADAAAQAAELGVLGGAAAAVLETALAAQALTPAPAPAVAPQAPDLDQLRALLESGNLRALELAEQLAHGAAPGSAAEALVARVRALDFGGALACLAGLGGRGRPCCIIPE